MALYLGLEASTQSLSAIVIEVEGDLRRIVFAHSLSFDRDLPDYETAGGAVGGRQPGEQLASPIMWADALDRMMSMLACDASVDIRRIRGISGAAQPSCVYLNRRARDAWRELAHDQPLAPQLAGTFARELSRVSTGQPGQDDIRAFHLGQPGAYAASTRIHLASSFLASLLIAADAPVDPGDGWSTNLMDLNTSTWSTATLEATAPGVILKLPDIRPSFTIAGPLGRYWRDRYSFPPAQVVTWSGQIPSMQIGTGIVSEGHLAAVFGTSDTLMALSAAPRVAASQAFASPMGGVVNLLCFRNGALTRDWVRLAHRLDWDGFAAALDRTPPGNDGALMLPWLEAEITPRVDLAGLRRFAYDGRDASQDVRAVVEGQMMAMANHAAAITDDLETIVATGSTAANDPVMQVMADVFGVPVDRLYLDEVAGLGAALRALHADRLASGEPLAWQSVVKEFTEPRSIDRVSPRPEYGDCYRDLRRRYAEVERLHQGRAPIG